jgi:hypothetical protein
VFAEAVVLWAAVLETRTPSTNGVQTENSKLAGFFQILPEAVFPESKPCIRGIQRLKLTFPAEKPNGVAAASRLKMNPA